MKSLLISTSQQEKLIQNETERRRTLRLLQTRQIEKQRAAQLRQTIADEKKKQTYVLVNHLKNEWVQQKNDLHDNLEYQFRENLMEMGKGHKEAADQPDYEHEWLTKTLDNDARAVERGQQALDKLHVDMMQNENERNLHILHRKAALELEKVRAQQVAKLPPPEDPLRDLQMKPTTIVTVHDPYNFTTTRYHLEERLVTKEDDQEGDAAQDAIIEQERVDAYVSDKQRLWNEQQEKARVRGDNALKREVLDSAYDNVLDELGKLERQDRDRRQKEIQNLPKSIFIPPWRREEERQERQRQMETAFEQAYQDTHRKQPIPIVLMNEGEIPEDEEEEDAASDRTLVAQNEEENPSPEYRMTTVTPSANTVPVADEIHEDDEATLADPTIMTLQTPLPEQQLTKQQQQQNMRRLMEKIERQRAAAQNRANQQAALVTPTIKTPKRLIVSPGYIDSSESINSSVTQQDIIRQEQSSSSSNTTTAEIEERRTELESRKKALEEQIRILSERASLLPQKSTCPMVSSSSDLSIESLLKNLRTTSNTASIPSTTSSIYAGKQHEDDHEQFMQAVQAIVTSDESQLQSSSSGIAIEDDERSHGTMSDDTHKGKFLFDKYESHSSEDRDHSLEDLISRLVATQQQSNHKQYQNAPLSETKLSNNQSTSPSLIIDDLVDDALSSISSLSGRTPVDPRSASPEIAQLLLLNRNTDSSQEFTTNTNDEHHFYEEKRLIEQELELIRRERESLLHEHEKYRQQTSGSSMKQQIPAQPPPPPSLLRTKLNIVSRNEVHELSTIQEVDTPASSRNTSLFHHRSPLKSSFDLQQLERISSADSSSSSVSEHNNIAPSQIPSISVIQQQQLISNTGLERDDSGISLIDGPRSSATSRTTLAGGNGGGGKSSSSGIQSLLTTRQPRVRTITNETTTTTTSTSANLPVVITTPRSNTESDDQSISSVSKKWRDILANECLPQLPQSSVQFMNPNRNDLPQLTHSLGFGSSTVEENFPTTTTASSNNPNDMFSSSQAFPTQEQILRSQYDNEQCDLMSLIKVHEYLTKQQHPSSTITAMEQLAASSPSTTTPIHHQSHSTLTSVTYRSSLAKQVLTSSGPPISTPSHTSFSSSEIPIHQIVQDGNERRNSLLSDIHHLTRSPNTFETSITSSSSSNSNKHQDTLSYLIEQNQRAMQRLISNHDENLIGGDSTTFYSSASMRVADYESGPLTAVTMATPNEKIQQKTTLIETGSISTLDFPSAILLAEEQISFEPSKLDCKIDSEDRGILDEPSLTLLSNSYRSLTTTTTGQHPTAVIVQSTSQKKKQCSSPLSNYDDKTSACSTPSLSPIKNEPLIMIHSVNRSEISTPLLSSKPPMCQSSPFIPLSSKNSSIQNSLEKPSNETSSDDTSLLSFERHELSAGNATLMTNNGDIDELKLSENLSLNHSVTTVHAVSTNKSKTTADWSYFVTVGQEFLKETQKSSLSSSSSSSSSSSDPGDSHSREHIGGVEYFINGEQQNASTPQLVQLPSLQSALQARRADFVTTSQKRVDEIKAKDYTKITTSSVPVPSRLLTQRASLTTTATITSTNSSKNIVETDSEERQRRTRESKERSKRLYDQLAEVQQKKKIHETKQQAHTYRARMNAFQAALDKKKTNNINNNK
ncbi:unnamed protein product [Rotaria socialis]|uniref:ALMS motif domain-containing protein n=2 Tax=Rotaria socialis TaxID=392032 RepID=A0A820NA73_9BILA|nr:unnamed protein product [Rotaria socialis]CAF4359156.1 unnamed protein product [Rotaria socialis]CAF4384878.1 unnamed protein product [Rotaria socialis]